MAPLQRLALQYQKALDSLSGPAGGAAANAAGRALLTAIAEATSGTGSLTSAETMHPVIKRTTLAASIVAYWERFPWAELTLQMLHFGAALQVSSIMLGRMYASASDADEDGRASDPRDVLLLLQQVRPSFKLSRCFSPPQHQTKSKIDAGERDMSILTRLKTCACERRYL